MKKLITSATLIKSNQNSFYQYEDSVDITTGLPYEVTLDDIALDILEQFRKIARSNNQAPKDIYFVDAVTSSLPSKGSYYLEYTFIFRVSRSKVNLDVSILVDSETQTCTIKNLVYEGSKLYEIIYSKSKSSTRSDIVGDEEGAVPTSVVKSAARKMVDSINRKLKRRGFSSSGLKASNFILDYFDPYEVADYMCDLTNSKGVRIPLVLKFEYDDDWYFLGTADDLSKREYAEYMFYDYCNAAGLDIELPEWYLATI